jgi:hypothetical protein
VIVRITTYHSLSLNQQCLSQHLAFTVTISRVTDCHLIHFCQLFTAEWLTAIGTVGATFLALILALWGEKIGRWFVRPKLSLKAHVGRPDSEGVHRQVDGRPAGLAYFFRLAIRNKGNTEARDAQVFLSKIELLVDGKPQLVTAFTPMNLQWAYLGQATLPVLLPDMPPRYCDLCHVEQPPFPANIELALARPASLFLDVEFPSNTGGNVLEAGTYLLHLILACSNGRPRRYTLKINFPGRWYADENEMFRSGFEMSSTHRDLWISSP